jgi:hypothetical protein
MLRLLLFSLSLAVWCSAVAFPQSDANVNDSNTASQQASDSNVPDEAVHADVNEFFNGFYSNYSEILQKYVDSHGLIDYPRLRRHRLELGPQAVEFAILDQSDYQSWPENEQKAFWINAYNFFAVNIVVRNYPIKAPRFARIWWPENSVVHIPDFYTQHFFNIMDREYNLSEIEQFLKVQFDDPNVSFALCKATLGSPILKTEPYRGYKLDSQLREQAKLYLAREVAFSLDSKENILYLAELFENDSELFIKHFTSQKFRAFEPKVQAAFNYINTYGNPENVEIINRITPPFNVQFQRINWRYFVTLNDASNK